jgi:predicted transcriptional regulator
MKGVDTIARIRREFFVRGKTIKEIVRELHVSRNTVRKVLRSGATEFTYERGIQPLPKLGGLWLNLVAEVGGVSSVMVEVTRKDTPWRRIALSRCPGQERASPPTRCWPCCARVRGAC